MTVRATERTQDRVPAKPPMEGNTVTTPKAPHARRLIRLAWTSGVLVSVGSGLAAIHASTEPYGARERATIPPLVVSVTPAETRSHYRVRREYVGVVEARRESRLGFELSGRVAGLQVEEGDFVQKGAVLARLDTRLLEAERRVRIAARDQAKAALELAELTRERRRKALASRVASAEQFDEADKGYLARAADLARAEAVIASIDVRLAKSILHAPFDALIAARMADEGRVLEAGVPVYQLLERVEPEVRIGVAGDAIDSVRVGRRHVLRVRDRDVDATVRSVLPVRGGGTRSVDVVLTLHTQFDGIRRGDLATLTLERVIEERGIWLPLTALTESSRGLWASYVAQPRKGTPIHLLKRRELELLHQDGERVYVRGTLRDGELVVTQGLHRLVPGQDVRIAGAELASTRAPDDRTDR